MNDVRPAQRKSRMETIARMLTAASTTVAEMCADARAPAGGRAAAIYADRRLRESWFRPGMFYDPAWDLMLYLFDAQEQRQAWVSVARAARACRAVSPESAQRWIDLLVDNGYVASRDEAGERALALSGKGVAAMSGYLRGTRVQVGLLD